MVHEVVNTDWFISVRLWKPMKVVESFQPRTCVDPRISKNDIAHFIRYKSKTYSFGVLSDEGLPCVNQIELMYIVLSQDLLNDLGYIDVGDGCWRRKFRVTIIKSPTSPWPKTSIVRPDLTGPAHKFF